MFGFKGPTFVDISCHLFLFRILESFREVTGKEIYLRTLVAEYLLEVKTGAEVVFEAPFGVGVKSWIKA